MVGTRPSAYEVVTADGNRAYALNKGGSEAEATAAGQALEEMIGTGWKVRPVFLVTVPSKRTGRKPGTKNIIKDEAANGTVTEAPKQATPTEATTPGRLGSKVAAK
jgi:hypothetical protein